MLRGIALQVEANEAATDLLEAIIGAEDAVTEIIYAESRGESMDSEKGKEKEQDESNLPLTEDPTSDDGPGGGQVSGPPEPPPPSGGN